MSSVVITGVSTGIGYATAKTLLSHGYHVFGSVRKSADAQRLQEELGEAFTPLLFDVTSQVDIEAAAKQVAQRIGDENLAGLINNAGVAVAGPLLELPVEEFQQQIDINLIGTYRVTQAFAPLLGAAENRLGNPGRIINISSIAGINAMPFMGPYAASKFGLEGYSEALRRELLIYGIDVVMIGPGPIQTPIWDKAQEMDISAYQNSIYYEILQGFSEVYVAMGKAGYPVNKVSELIYHALTTANPKVRYPIVKRTLLEKLIVKLASKKVLDKLIGKRVGLLK